MGFGSTMANVTFDGDETHQNTIAALSRDNDLVFELGETKWVNYEGFLKAFSSINGEDLTALFTINSVLNPDVEGG